MKRKQEKVDFGGTLMLLVSSSAILFDIISESELLTVCHACMCVWLQPYISHSTGHVWIMGFLTWVVS